MVKERFLKYISFDTQSVEESESVPSSEKQKLLGAYLVDELKSLGVDNAFLDEYGYVYGKIINPKSKKKVGLIAHLDTALEVSGKGVKPQEIFYRGGIVRLNDKETIDPKEYQSLNKALNHTIITTDGTTLLGADDKAGIAIIMSVICEILKEKENYPSVYVAFTPDEEIGRGTIKFNYDYFDVDFAYTIDGEAINYVNCENFNAASANIVINGLSIHPGSAKDKMINSLLVGMELNSMLPSEAIPAKTEKYQGFNHLTSMQGSCEKTEMNYIIRNHDEKLFQNQIEDFRKIVKLLNEKYGNDRIKLNIKESYHNMVKLINTKPEILDYPFEALKMNGITPFLEPIRGGTDGATLTYNGILCPNLGTGSYNHHGIKEYADITEMETMVKVIKSMLTLIYQK